MAMSLLDQQLAEAERDLERSRAMSAEQGRASGASPRSPRAPVPGAINGSEKAPDLSSEELKKGQNRRPWTDDVRKRFAVRMITRGGIGAACYVIGGSLGNKWLGSSFSQRAYSARDQWREVLPFTENGNVGKFTAKLIDTVAGKPIQAIVHRVTGSEAAGIRAVHFRPSAYTSTLANGQIVRGRSLGEESFKVTFDFFLMSIGDAMGRDMASWFDPNVKQSWVQDGNIKPKDAIKAFVKSWWRYTTYNGGEDWAVAIPYVYFMKAQRSALNSFSPGFKYDFDRGLNGGSWKVNQDNRIVGGYTQEGAIDLQTRFTAYNIGTLMYREVYNYLGYLWDGKDARLYGAPDSHDKPGLLGTASDLGKWVVRSAVKGTICMTPAVPFFWVTRSVQNQHKGLLIRGDDGFLAYNKGGSITAIRAEDNFESVKRLRPEWTDGPHENSLRDSTPLGYAQFSGSVANGTPPLQIAGPNSTVNPTFDPNRFHPYGMESTHLTTSPSKRASDAMGALNYAATKKLDGVASWADTNLTGVGTPIKRALGFGSVSRAGVFSPDPLKGFTWPFVQASISYTPYMIAKAETARLWDDGKMDTAIERMIEGATRFHFAEFKAGTGEIWNALLHRPFADPAREAIAQHRIAVDQSPADVFTTMEGEMQLPSASSLQWQSRTARTNNQEMASSGRASAYSTIIPQKEAGYTEQEHRRKAYAQAAPAAAV